jgi:DNA helicase IV
VAHPDLPAEQAYVDRAYEFLEKMRAAVERAPRSVDDEVLGAYLDAWAARRLATFEDAERGLCFGRLDLDETPAPLYVGRRWVHDDEGDMVVVNWQAPAARPFYTATPDDPQRVTLRRRFRTERRRLLDIADETFDGSRSSVAGGDFLLEELDRARDPHMRDIVATIQADQYALITRPPAPPVVVQGGPGTGKTAVGLHRASYLLFTHREEFGRRAVLVVGPNPTFMEYVSHVLPTLGEENVEQRAAGELVDGVVATRTEARDVAALKGDPRLADVVRRTVEALPPGEAHELVARLDGEFVRVREREVRELVEVTREEHGRGAAARERFRMELLRAFYRDYGRRLGGAAFRSFDEIERALRSSGHLQRVVDAAWPLASPEQIVRRLLMSPSRVAAAADGIFERGEQRLLLRDRPRRAADLAWSDHDLPLVDEAAALLGEQPHRYAHVIVDEAQDLTPMQLRMVGRRVRDRSYTLLGDVAQATGPIPYAGWDELLVHLPDGDAAETVELRHAYRVPAEIMALALPLLERIAPQVAPPVAFRPGGEPPRLERAEPDAVLRQALREAAALAKEPGLLAVIAPEELLAQIDEREGSAFDETVALLPPHRAKGLEFDHVVVVEPAAIARGDGLRGLRELYVALTRPTRTLVVVHAEQLPDSVGAR